MNWETLRDWISREYILTENEADEIMNDIIANQHDNRDCPWRDIENQVLALANNPTNTTLT